MSLKNSLSEYFNLQKEIYDYFGYVEDWVVIPLEDGTENYWNICDDEYYHSPQKYSLTEFKEFKDYLCNMSLEEDPLEIKALYHNMYGGLIYKQRFLKKWIYRGKDYTMIVANTQSDGNIFLYVFDNTKEVKE